MLLKKFLFFIFILSAVYNLFSYQSPSITFFPFDTASKIDEDISFLDKKCPELLYGEMMYIKGEGYDYNLSWEQAKLIELDEKSPLDMGKILKSDFVVYGKITQLSQGFKIDIKALNIKKRINEFSISRVSQPNEDVYTFLQETAKDIDNNFSVIVKNSIDRQKALRRMLSFQWGIGYPFAIGDFFNIQVGVFGLNSAFNINYKFFYAQNISLGIRAGGELSFNYFVNNPKKITGYFYDIILSFPVAFELNIYRRFNFLFVTSYKNVFSVYSYKGYDSVTRSFFTYCPAFGLGLNFEFPLTKNQRFNLGIENGLDFIFYIDQGVITKLQYESGVYLVYKLEV